MWGKVRGDSGGVNKCGGVHVGECGKVYEGVGINEGKGMGVWGRGDGGLNK